jgi:hypothetical protein
MDDLLLAHLTGTVGLHPKTAKGYADGLVAEGFETPAAFDALSLEELRDDFGFLKGHVMTVRKYRETAPAAPPQSPRSPQVGEPIGCVFAPCPPSTFSARSNHQVIDSAGSSSRTEVNGMCTWTRSLAKAAAA